MMRADPNVTIRFVNFCYRIIIVMVGSLANVDTIVK